MLKFQTDVARDIITDLGRTAQCSTKFRMVGVRISRGVIFYELRIVGVRISRGGIFYELRMDGVRISRGGIFYEIVGFWLGPFCLESRILFLEKKLLEFRTSFLEK